MQHCEQLLIGVRLSHFHDFVYQRTHVSEKDAWSSSIELTQCPFFSQRVRDSFVNGIPIEHDINGSNVKYARGVYDKSSKRQVSVIIRPRKLQSGLV